MPDIEGNLNDEEISFVIAKLASIYEKNGGKKPCQSCGESDYFVHPALMANRSDTVNTNQAHTRFPAVATYCKHCGHITMYSARILGIKIRLLGE